MVITWMGDQREKTDNEMLYGLVIKQVRFKKIYV